MFADYADKNKERRNLFEDRGALFICAICVHLRSSASCFSKLQRAQSREGSIVVKHAAMPALALPALNISVKVH
jgi:hypothetical protein